MPGRRVVVDDLEGRWYVNAAATTPSIKIQLREFLAWLEGVSMGTRQPG